MILQLPLFETIIRRLQAGRRIALCAVIETHGSAPQTPGAMLIIDEGLNTLGTLGGGCVEAEVCKQALEMLRKGESKLIRFDLDGSPGWDDGLHCGGGTAVAVMPLTHAAQAAQFRDLIDAAKEGRTGHVAIRVHEADRIEEYRVLVEAEPKLIIAGAGHVGAALARLCVDLEFDVTVVDDRPTLVSTQRLPPPVRPLVGDIEQTLRQLPIDRNTYVVIVTRGHAHDEAALHAVIDSAAKYVGMIGSGRKIKAVFDDLAKRGVSRERLDRVHAPIGLAINSITVPEIAVSIAAELISVRREHRPKLVEGPFAVAGGNKSEEVG